MSGLGQLAGPLPGGTVPGYVVLGRCWDDTRTVTYSGRHVESGAPVFIKTPKVHRVSARSSGELKRDYDWARMIGGPGLLKPAAYLANDGGEFLVLEDDGTRPIGELLGEPLDLNACLELAVRLAEALDRLHQAQVVHGNLNPYSVWFDRVSWATRLTDFSLAWRVTELAVPPASRAPSDLLFIAPEQTGRLNQPVDSRTDLYALGIILYQLIAGKPLFDDSSAVELIHAHLARIPIAPHVINREVPVAISEILMKLLAKAPAARYQSARGLRADLCECLAAWRARGVIEDFAPGGRDSASVFTIARKVYGRESALAGLRAALARTAEGMSELVVVSGAAGVGKSALVRAIEPEVNLVGTFVAAKFDQFSQNEPYSFIVQCFKELIDRLLGESEGALSLWRKRLAAALGANARIVVDLIPELELIIGKPPPPQRVPAAEERNRFNMVFRQLIRMFAREAHPLVMFLDDVQWADSDSLRLLEILLCDRDIAHLMVVAARRTGAGGEPDRLAGAFADLREAGVPITHIELPRLEAPEITALVADTFRCGAAQAASLAAVLLQKTAGNPLFVNQFLRFLDRERLVEFDFENSCWVWDVRRIAVQGVTEDVIDLMTRKLDALPPATKEALKVASCLGSRFALAQLAPLTSSDLPTLFAALQAAEREGLIVAEEVDGAAQSVGAAADDAEAIGHFSFCFIHDRVQQAAHSLIPAHARGDVRLSIGRKLLGSLPPEERDAVPFSVLDNLNDGADLLTDPAEREAIAKLNLAAALRCRESAAYVAALGYFGAGKRLLARDAWQSQYELTLALYLGLFECSYLTGNLGEATALFDEILDEARTRFDKSAAYYIKILLCSGLDRSEEAVALGIEALRLFGLELPRAPSKFHLVRELVRIGWLLRGRRAQDLLALPAMTDADRSTAIKLLMSICPAAYFRNPDLMSLAALKIMGISLSHGNAGATSFGYVLFGLIQGALFGRYRRGHEFGTLAAALAERDGSIIQRCKIVMIFAGFYNYWRKPIDSSIEMLRLSLKLAVDAGDLQYANYSILQTIFLSLARGANLSQVLADCSEHQRFIDATKDWFAIASLGIRRQQIRALIGQTERADRLSDAHYDEDANVASFREAGNLTTLSYYLIVKMQLAYLAGRFEEAYAYAESSERQIRAVFSQIVVAEHYFYKGLSAAALIRRRHHDDRLLRRDLARCRRRVRQWALNCPENFRQHHLLLEAEAASLKGRAERAEALYDAAINAAQEQRFTHLAALANELAAESCLARDRSRVARTYLIEARRAYAHWGAAAKTQQLSAAYASLLRGAEAEETAAAREPQGAAGLIELDTVLQATAQISQEKEPGRLMAKLLRLFVESAGGERGFIVGEQPDGLAIDAATGDPAAARVDRVAEVENHLSGTAVKYVLRTGRQLVLDDAPSDPRFGQCAYIRRHRPRSLLCLPLANKGDIVGAVYVEHRLLPRTFTADRVRQLTLLAQQLAVVAENSRLQRNLSENVVHLQAALGKVEMLERVKGHLTKFVPHSLQKLIEANPQDPDFGAREEDVSILFLDIAGYTDMSENVAGEQLNAILETYFSSFLDDIHQNHGDINDVAGDGLMIIFQNQDAEQHARLAARTALAMRQKTARLNGEARGKWPAVTINIGVHSGTALVGANKLESRLGTRWVYTANGYATNLAARIGASAAGGAILLSESTAARLGAQFEVGDTGQQRFKGISQPVRVFRLIGERGGAS